jgi:isoaspartyl peptidase/L-asparaginase-like protein (Ntn-hydrolase superfamily)
MNRRKFIFKGSLVSAGLIIDPAIGKAGAMNFYLEKENPVVISTWDFGFKANEISWKVMTQGGNSLDAVEKGIMLIEADADNLSVGIGGLPDREGIVTLDACIMDEQGRAGSVTFLQNIVHAISVARLVMEKTPHVMLSGDGALQFALECGFTKQDLLTQKAKAAWEEWKKKSQYKPVINIENHDTVGLLALDQAGNLAGGCSTSGLAYKMHGRVGDSPIIGAGLYVDNEVGAAVATGLGELVMRNLSSFLVVELMRNGAGPQEACQEAIQRIAKKNPDYKDYQVGLIALGKDGQTGAFSLQPGFNYAVRNQFINEVVSSPSLIL